ncbi:HAD family hydrolase [Chromobacterium vaccinii]|uniref:HAD family hydrolase n=1 Tax=Chromobacterium vaccinii TaxID=1108595 RepID=UPI003C77CABF
MKPAEFALLLDLDGTLANSNPLHYQAFSTLLAENGKTLTPELYHRDIVGGSNAGIMRALFPERDQATHRAMAERKEALFRASVTTLEPTPGTHELFAWAQRRGFPIAVVTNAPRANAELMLERLGLASQVAALVIGEELAAAKPDPLPYLTGLARVSARADRACAFEDSPSGIRAARAAGLPTFALRSALPAESLLAAGADAVIDDFAAPELWRWLEAARAGMPA